MNKKFSILFIISFFTAFVSAQDETYTIRRTSFSTDRFDEFSPVYYKDGLVFCTNNNTGQLVDYSSSQGGGTVNIYFVDTTGNKRAGLFSGSLRTKANDGPVTFNSTGDTIYYSRNMRIDGRAKDISSVRNRLGIFFAVDDGKKWSGKREFRFNNEWYNISTPWLAPDSRRLYFASDMPDGYGGTDLYYSEWKGYYWDEPVNMGSVINTKGNEAYPFVTPAGEILFASDGHPGLGGKDIFYSRLVNDEWLTPVRFDPPVNSQYDDFGIITDSLMSKGYFSSNRLGSIDIYEFETLYPQIFYADIQRENTYCFVFTDTGNIKVDTTILRYEWDFGDGSKAFGETVNHCFPGPGEYKVRLNITDRATRRLYFSKLHYTLTLRDYEQPYITSPDVAVAGEQILLNGLDSYLPGYEVLSYIWDFGNNTRMEGPEVSVTFKEAGEFDVNMGVKLRSLETGIIHNSGISKTIRVVNSEKEKEEYLSRKESSKEALTDVHSQNNAFIDILYSAEQGYLQDAVFRLRLLSSRARIAAGSDVFAKLPEKYNLKEIYDELSGSYQYFADEQISLIALQPAFTELYHLGFRDVTVVQDTLISDAEKQLVALRKNYGQLADDYFDSNGRLRSSAYLLLDQIVMLMNQNPEMRLEIEVHTDNSGSASANLRTSRTRAQLMVNYLVNRGVNLKRLTARGYGGEKPIASNLSENGRKQNRRVGFRIIN